MFNSICLTRYHKGHKVTLKRDQLREHQARYNKSVQCNLCILNSLNKLHFCLTSSFSINLIISEKTQKIILLDTSHIFIHRILCALLYCIHINIEWSIEKGSGKFWNSQDCVSSYQVKKKSSRVWNLWIKKYRWYSLAIPKACLSFS